MNPIANQKPKSFSSSSSSSTATDLPSESLTPSRINYIKSQIEIHLHTYKSQLEIINILQDPSNNVTKTDVKEIECEPTNNNPIISSIETLKVWSLLSLQNPDFFYKYYIQLKVNDQVKAFDYLVSQGERLEY